MSRVRSYSRSAGSWFDGSTGAGPYARPPLDDGDLAAGLWMDEESREASWDLVGSHYWVLSRGLWRLSPTSLTASERDRRSV